MESLSTFLLSLSTAQNQGKDVVDVGNDDTNAVVDVSVRQGVVLELVLSKGKITWV